jgi:hypothetical protein
MRGSFASLEDDGEKQATATAKTDNGNAEKQATANAKTDNGNGEKRATATAKTGNGNAKKQATATVVASTISTCLAQAKTIRGVRPFARRSASCGG